MSSVILLLRVRSVNSLGFTAGMQFCDQADLKRYSRLKNQSASIDANGSAGFFFVSEHPKKKKSGGLGVNKRNRGYPAGFEFIERPLTVFSLRSPVMFFRDLRSVVRLNDFFSLSSK